MADFLQVAKKLLLLFPPVKHYVVQKNRQIYQMEEQLTSCQETLDSCRAELTSCQAALDSCQAELKEVSSDTQFPNGHYHSPIVSLKEVRENEKKLFPAVFPDHISGIDLNINFQNSLLDAFGALYKELPFTSEKIDQNHYYYENDFFSYGDAISLYSIIRYFNPKTIIEVGSGFSSAVIMDTNRIFFHNQILGTFIEPYPERLFSLMSEEDDIYRVIVDKMQNVPLSEFRKLDANDILLIDSTHVSKLGSDVNRIIHEVLPALNKGVIIHFHDIFYPFEIPQHWVMRGLNWNETYMLRAFLEYNHDFEILFWNNYYHTSNKELLFKKMPLYEKNAGGSIWIRKK